MTRLQRMRREVSLAEVAGGVIEAIVPERRHEVVLDVREDVRAVVDEPAIRSIVANLLENALTYGDAPVRVAVGREARCLYLEVEDCGRGVSPQFVPKLFGPFARSERSRLDGGGAGLGLAISDFYARLHRGELVYEPAEPHGARFRLLLPPQEAEAQEARAAGARPAARLFSGGAASACSQPC